MFELLIKRYLKNVQEEQQLFNILEFLFKKLILQGKEKISQY